MSRRKLAVALTTALMTLGFLVPSVSSSAQTAPVKIMPLGDSITGSPGCWRALLWQKLQTNGYTNIDFVGSQPPQGCSVPYDGDSEGRGGALATTTASSGYLVGALSTANPDIVMMHFGTNDVWSNKPTADILAAFTTLVNQMRANNANMKILVAQIIPVAPSDGSCPACPQRTIDLNNAIPGWAAGLTTTQSPITVVDQWTGWDPAADTGDGVHPNDPTGITIMANKWYPALSAAIGPAGQGTTTATTTTRATSSTTTTTTRATSSTTTTTTTRPVTTTTTTRATTTTTTSRPATTTTTTGGAGRTCTAAYAVASQWTGGFQGTVTVTAGSSPITSWKVTWTFPNGQTITQSWSATVTSSGSSVTATNAAWNGALAASASTTFGFIANWTGSNGVPALTCTAA